MGDYPPRDSVEIKFCPDCGTACAGVVRLAEDGHTFEAAAAFFISGDTAIIKGGVVLGRGVPRVTTTHRRRAEAALHNFGLVIDWFHNGRRLRKTP